MSLTACLLGFSRLCREEFQCSNFGLEFRDPSRFAQFQWGWPKVYLIWRGVVSVYHVTMIFCSGFLGRENWTRTEGDAVTWFIYLTHWMFFTLTACTVLQFVNVVYINVARNDIISGEAVQMPVFLRLTWVSQSLANNVSLLVTLLFWGILYKPGYPLTFMDAVTHAGNTAYVIVNTFVSASPVRFLHFIYPFVSAIVYIVFSVIYYVAGGHNGLGHRYIYSVLDWSKPGRASLYACLCSCAGVPTVQVLLVLLCWLRIKLYGKCVNTSSCSDTEMGSRDK